jgi:hypothetical protein
MSKFSCNSEIFVLQPLYALHVGNLGLHSLKSRPMDSGLALIVGFGISAVQ